ncbi:septum formation initiator family protein [Patescibacteria group bacterium]|nr:septum formation initiator family protein [Patescibacteria group bacterium]
MAQMQYPTKKILSSKTALLGLLIVFILLISVVIKNSNQQKKNSQQAIALENEILALEKQNQELDQLIDFFSKQEFVEKQAREKLGLAKPGEKLVIIPKQQLPEKELDQNKSMPELWFKYFFQ